MRFKKENTEVTTVSQETYDVAINLKNEEITNLKNELRQIRSSIHASRPENMRCKQCKHFYCPAIFPIWDYYNGSRKPESIKSLSGTYGYCPAVGSIDSPIRTKNEDSLIVESTQFCSLWEEK